MCGSQFTVEMPWILTFQLLFAFDNIALSILRFGPGFKCILCTRVGSLDSDVPIAVCPFQHCNCFNFKIWNGTQTNTFVVGKDALKRDVPIRFCCPCT